MQEQRGAMSSFTETLRFEHGSASGDIDPEQDYISLDSPSNRLSDYISLNSTNEEDQNISMWNVDESSSSSGRNEINQGHVDPFGQSSDQFDIDDHRVSRKRKASELSIGQSSSSGVGSSSMLLTPDGGSSAWDSIGEDPSFDPTIPRLGLSVGGVFSRPEDPLPSNNNVENNINNSRQIDIRSRSPPIAATPDNIPTHSSPPGMRTPLLRRNLQSTSRWVRSSSSRAIRSANLDSTSDHPLFAQPSNESSNDVGGGSRAGLSSMQDASYRARRLSAYLRRSLLSAATDLEADEGEHSNIIPRIPPALSTLSSPASQDIEIPPVVGIQDQPHRQQQPQSRSSLLLSRHLEGRGRLVSELRNVVDRMRRGEHVRFEDLMLLDHSVVGIADIHDRHRDMRLDIDNMSYEELLALEERIGNVNTGLTEEKILKHLKQTQYMVKAGRGAEPCCICQEEYIDGDDLGALECKHEFHRGCIKQWLQKKNSCPICKSTGFAAT